MLGLGARGWREPKPPVESAAVAFYDVAVHGRRVREYERDGQRVVGRKAAKRLGLILTKKQRARAKREAASSC